MAVYQENFPGDYGNPKIILRMVAEKRLEDTSWKGDSSPSFGAKLEDGKWLRIWVEHPNDRKRKGSDFRYSVFVQKDLSSAPEETIVETDDLGEALFYLENTMARRGKPGRFRLLGR